MLIIETGKEKLTCFFKRLPRLVRNWHLVYVYLSTAAPLTTRLLHPLKILKFSLICAAYGIYSLMLSKISSAMNGESTIMDQQVFNKGFASSLISSGSSQVSFNFFWQRVR